MVPFGQQFQLLCLISSILEGFPRGLTCRLRPAPLSHNQNRAWNQALGPIVLCQAARNA
jgi:hypothetical protein